jgi:hypothetical protein
MHNIQIAITPHLDDVLSIFEADSNSTFKKRVLIDSNIWRYIVDANVQGSFLRLAKEGPYAVQIAPAVLYEALRVKDTRLRAKLVHLMTDRRLSRLMPEAFSESMEILREIRRLRPEWLLKEPNFLSFDRLRKDWMRKAGGFWVRCERSPGAEAKVLVGPEVEMLEGARRQSKDARREMIEIGWKKNPSMDKTLMGFRQPVPGWNGEPVEAWRLDALVQITHSLRQPHDPYRNWMSPFAKIDQRLLASAGWVQFWAHLVERHAVPRQWMRWAHSFAQRFRKVTPGSPCDSQLFTYFLETDVVITADAALLEILEECRPFAPCPLPAGKLMSAGDKGVEQLLHILGTVNPRENLGLTQF